MSKKIITNYYSKTQMIQRMIQKMIQTTSKISKDINIAVLVLRRKSLLAFIILNVYNKTQINKDKMNSCFTII